jgi:hypothetical protein
MTAADNIRMTIFPLFAGVTFLCSTARFPIGNAIRASRASGVGTVRARKIFPEKYFSLNTCVRNVSALTQSCDTCRVLVHLPHDRAPFARHATENIFCMSAAHERHLASALACENESR